MVQRQRLSEAQISELYDPPTEQHELVRHFSLSQTDLAANRRCRGDHNRLGQALMLWLPTLSRARPHWPENHRRLLEPIGNIPPAEAEERYYAMLDEPAMAA